MEIKYSGPGKFIKQWVNMGNAQLSHKNDGRQSGSKNDYPAISITEAITNGFFTVDRKWTVKQWNKSAENILKIKAKDIVGKNLWDKFAAVIPLKFYSVYHKAFLEDIPLHFEEYWDEMGAWFDVITYHYDGILSVSFKSSKESGRHVHLEEQLKILNQLYRYVTEVTNDCLWEWNLPAKEIFWIDGGHKKAFGYPIVNAIIPQVFWENRLHPDDKTRILEGINKSIASSADAWEDEYRFRKADGEYAYVHDRAHIIYDKNWKACRMVGATQDISARKSAQINLLESERKLALEKLTRQKAITDAVLRAQEVERSEIGKELHDNLNQILGAAKLYIELARTDEANRDMCLETSSAYVLNVIESIRRISKTLIIPGVPFMNLSESIHILLDDLVLTNPVKIEFYENGMEEKSLDQKLQVDILRIVQEQLNNILRHSKATEAIIALTGEPFQIVLVITDNGEGCDISKEKGGVGIINIRSRAELHQGRVAIRSQPGGGYELKVVLPLDSQPAAHRPEQPA